MATKLKDVYDLHKRECWSCKTINEHEAAITPWVLCPHCGSQDTRRITPKVPPQAGSSGEGLKVGDEVTPAQAEPVATKPTALPNWPPGAVADITAALDAEFEQQMEAKRPAVGSRVLVEAVVSHDNWHRDTVLVDVGTSINVKVHLSQLRPLTVVQGEGEGK